MTIQTKRGLIIEAYSTGTTRIADPRNELFWAEGLSFANAFPGGDMDAAFTVKRPVVAWWALKGAQRIVFRQGDRMVYEGYVSALDRMLDEQGQAIRVPLIGGWSHILMNRRWHKLWADRRVSDNAWQFAASALSVDDITLTAGEIDRNNRLKLLPKNVQFASNKFIGIKYSMPTGETVKRITFSYDFQEAGQAWKFLLYGVTGATTPWNVTASATSTADVTLATPSQVIWFLLQNVAGGNQTPPDDGTVYGQVSDVVVYSETGAINPTEVTIDVIGHFTDLNASTAYVVSNTLDITPFISEWDTAAGILLNACSFGDSSNNHWAPWLLNSENAPTPDGKPVLRIQSYPALTGYDYAIRLNEDNIAGAVQITQDFDAIANWVIVQYTNDQGWPVWITPDDDATLKDTTSIAAYGQRDYLLQLGYSTATVATSNGVRLLKANKDPQWNASPIPIWDHIRRSGRDPIPAARIYSAFRLKVEDFTSNLTGTDTDLTMLITGTRYDDETGVNTLTFGQPLSPMMTILAPPPRIIESAAGGGGASYSSGGGGKGNKGKLNWKREMGLKPGTPEWERASKMSYAEKQAYYGGWKAKKKKKG